MRWPAVFPGCATPAVISAVGLRRDAFSMRSVVEEIRSDRQTYVYSAMSTTAAFALFGGVLGHYADRLKRIATTDPLTGLFNPRAFHDELRHELGRMARYREPLSLLLMDLDGLKRVNDQFGHEAGDAASVRGDGDSPRFARNRSGRPNRRRRVCRPRAADGRRGRRRPGRAACGRWWRTVAMNPAVSRDDLDRNRLGVALDRRATDGGLADGGGRRGVVCGQTRRKSESSVSQEVPS